jgi:hypothetical protein
LVLLTEDAILNEGWGLGSICSGKELTGTLNQQHLHLSNRMKLCTFEKVAENGVFGSRFLLPFHRRSTRVSPLYRLPPFPCLQKPPKTTLFSLFFDIPSLCANFGLPDIYQNGLPSSWPVGYGSLSI